MPDFFVPFAASGEEAEQIYHALIEASGARPQVHGTSRLFRIAFEYGGERYVAEVGREIAGWAEPTGRVLAIIESLRNVLLHTQFKSGLAGGPVLVRRRSVSERVYFDDFPPET